MGRYHYHINEDEKNIIRSLIRLDNKRRRGKLNRRTTSFDKKLQAAIEKAEEDMELEEDRLAAVRENILYGVPYERAGAIYCARNTFYSYTRRYIFFVGLNMGIYDGEKKKG